ncbi:hypothetical protein GH810_16850 [Acetobacterium paludosum]|uniref:Uncharacterized protein n=1 Tax=Acetobacterium paludosum TaxID=52693 RepID=A0A923KXT3_9FIRM|nr:hypothetical protein [Acetobacterium paludosum]MBC3889970.1 hypothetical protein [Acetobacterium paludosum]
MIKENAYAEGAVLLCRFYFSIGLFVIAFVWMALFFIGLFPGFIPFAWFRPEYKEFCYYVVPVFSGFFLLKSLLMENVKARLKNQFKNKIKE